MREGDTVRNTDTSKVGQIARFDNTNRAYVEVVLFNTQEPEWWPVDLTQVCVFVVPAEQVVPIHEPDPMAGREDAFTSADPIEQDINASVTNLEQPDPFDTLVARATEVFGADQIRVIETGDGANA